MLLPTESNTAVAASATSASEGRIGLEHHSGTCPMAKGGKVTSRMEPGYPNLSRIFDFLAFAGILSAMLTLARWGVGAASIAAISALVGVCGRIWVAISRPSGAIRRDKAHVAWAPGKWQGRVETERHAEGAAEE